MKILVLEDDALVANGLIRLFRQRGHRALHVRRVAQARAIVDSQMDLDVVIADLQLSGGESGAEFLRWLASERPLVRRVLISAQERPGDFREEPPRQLFISKPFAPPMLAELVCAAPTSAT